MADWFNDQCVDQIIKHSKLEGALHMLSTLHKQRDRFFPEGGRSPAATAKLNEEIKRVEAHIEALEEKGYDRWKERCADWASDVDITG